MTQRNGKRAFGKRKLAELRSAHSASGSPARIQSLLHNNLAAQAFDTLVSARETFGIVVDAAGIIRTVEISDHEQLKPSCATLVGLPLHEALGEKTCQVFAESFGHSARSGRAEEMGCLIELPGGRRWFSVVIRCRSTHRTRPRLFSIFVRGVTSWNQAQESDVLQRLSLELMRARDSERREMARDLHESAGQSLAALKMTLGNLREALPGRKSPAHSHLQSCVDLTNEAVREVRTISYLMHPPMLDEAGLASALRLYAKGFSARSEIHVDVEVSDDFGRLPQEIETALFRIIQEALTNVHRYSGSKVARIRLVRDPGSVRAEVQDEGCGLLHPSQSTASNYVPGVGIAGMRERVRQLSGIFEIDSVRGSGTLVRVILPLVSARTGAIQVKLQDPDGGRSDANLGPGLESSSCPQGESNQ